MTLEISFAVVVWGDSYLELFLNTTLPNHLSSINLPACAKYGYLVYQIYTRPEDAAKIERHPSYRALSSTADVSVMPLLTGDTAQTANNFHDMIVGTTAVKQ